MCSAHTCVELWNIVHKTEMGLKPHDSMLDAVKAVLKGNKTLRPIAKEKGVSRIVLYKDIQRNTGEILAPVSHHNINTSKCLPKNKKSLQWSIFNHNHLFQT